MYQINCKGKLIDLSTPKVMGILNLTPDSFYDGGWYDQIEGALEQVSAMLTAGATFIDMGAYSSRPEATDISPAEELQRLIPVISEIISVYPEVLISVDTFRASVAKNAIEAGAALINDISGGTLDPHMLATVGDLGVPYVMMHMRGSPQTMNSLTTYDDLAGELLYYFGQRIALARKHKINDLIIDPGFGFAKTIPQNFELLQQLDLFNQLELPMLVGLSRKSTIYKTLGITAQEALNGTTVLNTLALLKGARILRVHDVREAMECIQLIGALS